jgi:hypothetical protein
VKPHLPFTAPKKYWDLFDPQALALAANQRDPVGAPGLAGKRGGEIVNYDPLSIQSLKEEATQRTLLHGYYACASFVDAQIGKVLTELDRLKLAENTIVVLWGDHGWHLGDHGYWTKHTNYEQANRIPLLIVAPGVTKAGSVTRQRDAAVGRDRGSLSHAGRTGWPARAHRPAADRRPFARSRFKRAGEVDPRSRLSLLPARREDGSGDPHRAFSAR